MIIEYDVQELLVKYQAELADADVNRGHDVFVKFASIEPGCWRIPHVVGRRYYHAVSDNYKKRAFAMPAVFGQGLTLLYIETPERDGAYLIDTYTKTLTTGLTSYQIDWVHKSGLKQLNVDVKYLIDNEAGAEVLDHILRFKSGTSIKISDNSRIITHHTHGARYYTSLNRLNECEKDPSAWAALTTYGNVPYIKLLSSIVPIILGKNISIKERLSFEDVCNLYADIML